MRDEGPATGKKSEKVKRTMREVFLNNNVLGIPSRALILHIDEAEASLGATFKSFTTELSKHGHEGHWT